MERQQTNDGRTPEIPRNSPTVETQIGEHALKLDWYSTLIQVYSHPYQDMTHLEHTVAESGKRLFVFSTKGGDDYHLLALQRMRFPTRLDPEPSDQVVRYYSAWQADEAVKIIEGDF